MELVVIVEPSDGFNPGHMVVGQENEGRSVFFGFVFEPDSLPAEHRHPSQWQEFLYANSIQGEIREESAYVLDLRRRKPTKIFEKRVTCDAPIESHIPPKTDWKQSAHYSFRPDDFHRDHDPCYNCVTWATLIANILVPGFLKPVQQGRIKLIVKQLELAGGKEGSHA